MANEKSIMEMYLNEIRKIPLMTREEENDLAKKAAAGDRDARAKIVRANLRFVVNIAKQYQNRGLEFSDLVNEGNIGLLNAIDRFDAGKGYHFISYAVWWIRQAIMKAICERDAQSGFHRTRPTSLHRLRTHAESLDTKNRKKKRLSRLEKCLAWRPHTSARCSTFPGT